MTVTITGLNIVRDHKPNKSGSTILAYFDCVARGIALSGCGLLLRGKKIEITPPRIVGPESTRRYVEIIDPALRKEILSRVTLAVKGLGGLAIEPEGTTVETPETATPNIAAVSDAAADTEGLSRFLAEAV